MHTTERTDAAQAIASAALDSYSRMLAVVREQAARRDAEGYSFIVHPRGTITLTGKRDEALISVNVDRMSCMSHGWTPHALRGLAAAAIAAAEQIEAQP